MDIFDIGNREASLVLIRPVDERGLDAVEREYLMMRERAAAEFGMACFIVRDWNRELSPWSAPAVFGKEAFGGGAAGTLAEISAFCSDSTKTYVIGGYSLAGLFSLWAACETTLFKGVAAASPSVWFPGFSDYMRERKMNGEYVYLSLGDKEAKTRHPVMAGVGDDILRVRECLAAWGTDCFFEWNEGNHFKDVEERTAKAFLWVISCLAGRV